MYTDDRGLPFDLDLRSLPIPSCDPWMNDLVSDLSHFHVPEFTTPHAPLDAMNPHDFGFYEQSIPQRHCEDVVGHLSCTTRTNDSVVAA
jgi:hypothetical protein